MTEAHGPAAVIAGYRRLRVQVAEMLALTEAEDWDTLIERQHAYLTQVERLKALDADCELDAGDATRKAELLEAILADDLVIRDRLMARRDELGQLLDRSRRQRDLQRTYGRQGSAVRHGADTTGKGSP
ncbi:flagellar protein FliT [Halomonas sp. NO4]|uniref:flagellar protein FliT n=1 Tax=Halomonas sp. NO4 TaxID=2484813 RepID=UPI001F08DAF8|nr:flagellar protein FliT [Halomonas sp. NO4]